MAEETVVFVGDRPYFLNSAESLWQMARKGYNGTASTSCTIWVRAHVFYPAFRLLQLSVDHMHQALSPISCQARKALLYVLHNMLS